MEMPQVVLMINFTPLNYDWTTQKRSSSTYQLKAINLLWLCNLLLRNILSCIHSFIHSFNSIGCNGDSRSCCNFISSWFHICYFRILFFWIFCSLNACVFNKMSKSNIKIKLIINVINLNNACVRVRMET